MNFRRGSSREDPEINLIPMIDVLLVLLIFLMVSTTYTRERGLKVQLPEAVTPTVLGQDLPAVYVAIDSQGKIQVDDQMVGDDRGSLARVMTEAFRNRGKRLVIRADAMTAEGRVVTVMDVAQSLGVRQVTVQTRGVSR